MCASNNCKCSGEDLTKLSIKELAVLYNRHFSALYRLKNEGINIWTHESLMEYKKTPTQTLAYTHPHELSLCHIWRIIP
jgi:hypothetical protein